MEAAILSEIRLEYQETTHFFYMTVLKDLVAVAEKKH